MLSLVLLILIVFLIILSTTRWHVHPFLALLGASLLMGVLLGMSPIAVVGKIVEGFGGTLKSIGIVIAFGTIIGVFLERSGAATTLAEAALSRLGDRRAPLAMNLTGFIVSIPVFCDSGFVILSSLNRAISRRSGVRLSLLAVALATGLYATHVFVPPTPGPLAAAATLEADLGLVLLLGLLVAVPVSAAGLFWAIVIGRHLSDPKADQPVEKREPKTAEQPTPSLAPALMPIVLPIFLIALKSVADYPTHPLGIGWMARAFGFLGHPVVALLLGVMLAFSLAGGSNSRKTFVWVNTALQNAGSIILITGAGGALGYVLRESGVGESIGKFLIQYRIGVLLPFLVAALLKSAQGSSTVAIITTAALMSPLLEPLGFAGPMGRALVVVAIGAGAMTVSHLNDSYFWVVAQFSNMEVSTALRGLTLGTLVQGITGAVMVVLLSLLF
ncbi:MAG: GntP family permease [Calditrichaeota bacterium]|nr:MAG: GntP family permease [Calditrichota bacterium]